MEEKRLEGSTYLIETPELKQKWEQRDTRKALLSKIWGTNTGALYLEKLEKILRVIEE